MTSETRNRDELTEILMKLGDKIRTARHDQGISLLGLAEMTGLSRSMISLVERGLAAPSIGTLVAISSQLQTPLSELMTDVETSAPSFVIRRHEQLEIEVAPAATRRVIRSDALLGYELSLNSWQPDHEPEPEPARHPGFECGLVLTGQLGVEVDKDSFVLEVGDCVAYPSTTPHRLYAVGSVKVTAVWFNLVPRPNPAVSAR